MSDARRPHAIHGMRARMNRVSLTAETAGVAMAELSHLVGASIDKGQGFFHEQWKALEVIEGVIADLQFIATETAVPQYEPGHTQKRKPASPLPTKQGGPLL